MLTVIKILPIILLAGCSWNTDRRTTDCLITAPDGTTMECRVKDRQSEGDLGGIDAID